MVRFTVHGRPVPKQSFRIGRQNYQSGRVTDWQRLVAQHAMLAMVGKAPFKGQVKVSIRFYLDDKRARDLDNLSKGCLDAGNGILWEDDAQISELHLYRERGKPGIDMEVSEC